jgi:hypothetical protein
MTRKMYYVSSNELLISHASTAYLEERKRKLILERRKSNHIKEKDRSSTWTGDGRRWCGEDDNDDEDADDNDGEYDNADDIGWRGQTVALLEKS